MHDTATDCTAIDDTAVFLRYFNDLHDPRQPGKVCDPLDEVLLPCLLAVLAGTECFTEIALFGVKKIDLPRRFRPFKDGTPAHDHLGDILAVLDTEQLQRCFAAWVAGVTGMPRGVIAIDSLPLRRRGATASAALPARNAARPPSTWCPPLGSSPWACFAAHQRLVLGQVRVAEKSNEIIAIPKILELLAIEGTIISIDAMGCQRGIAQKIIDKKADDVLALKGNQGSLQDDVELFVTEQNAKDFADTKISTAASKPGSRRCCTTSHGCTSATAGPA